MRGVANDLISSLDDEGWAMIGERDCQNGVEMMEIMSDEICWSNRV